MKQVSLDSKSYLGFLTLKTCPPLQVEQTQINLEERVGGKNLSNLKTSLSKMAYPSPCSILCPLPNSLGIFLCIFFVIQISQPKPP